MINDSKLWKKSDLWHLFECKVAWFGFYKQNNKFGNFNQVLATLDKEIYELRSKLCPSKILGDQKEIDL